jgi:hypothetical protein
MPQNDTSNVVLVPLTISGCKTVDDMTFPHICATEKQIYKMLKFN